MFKKFSEMLHKLKIINPYYNPYYYWWKVRKYWKMPKIHLAHVGKTTWWYGLPCSREYYNKYFDCCISGLGWKDKFDEPRFEWDPYFCLTFFRKWQIIFVWNFCPYFLKKVDYARAIVINENTWEVILSMTNYNMNVLDACKNSGFSYVDASCSNKDDARATECITVLGNLTKYGLEQYTLIFRSKN